jgi:hypothetical protein
LPEICRFASCLMLFVLRSCMGIVRVCKQHDSLAVQLVMTDKEKINSLKKIKTIFKSFKHNNTKKLVYAVKNMFIKRNEQAYITVLYI